MPYGPFHATTIILGIEEAKTQARREELMLPACFIHEVAQISQPVEEPQPPKRLHINEQEYIDIDQEFNEFSESD